VGTQYAIDLIGTSFAYMSLNVAWSSLDPEILRLFAILPKDKSHAGVIIVSTKPVGIM
jgi:hypothetical protein